MDVNPIIGKPYQLGGRGPDLFDCWGVVLWVYQRLGAPLTDVWTSDSSKVCQLRAFRAGAAALAVPFDQVPQPRDHDLAMDARKGHIGVVLGGHVLHATQTHGVALVPLEAFATLYPQTTFHRCLTLP